MSKRREEEGSHGLSWLGSCEAVCVNIPVAWFIYTLTHIGQGVEEWGTASIFFLTAVSERLLLEYIILQCGKIINPQKDHFLFFIYFRVAFIFFKSIY